MNIQQLNIQYQPIEDRLLLRILSSENSELRIWLTRKYTALLLKVLDQLIEYAVDSVASPGVEAVKAFQREAALSDSNFKDGYREELVSTSPLGETPLLVSRIDYTRLSDGNLALTLAQEFEGGKKLTINLDTQLQHALVKLLIEGARTAEWGLVVGEQVAMEGVQAVAAGRQLH